MSYFSPAALVLSCRHRKPKIIAMHRLGNHTAISTTGVVAESGKNGPPYLRAIDKSTESRSTLRRKATMGKDE